MIFNKIATINSILEAKNGANNGVTKLTAIKLKPHKVIKEAKGTMKRLASMVIGEKILK